MQVPNNAQKYIDKEIELITPLLPALVSVIRLTVSGITSAIGFDIETIEDIKVAVSEICNKLITNDKTNDSKYAIRFSVTEQKFVITFSTHQNKEKRTNVFDEQDEFAIAIVNALVDEVTIHNANENQEIISLSVFLKGHKV